MSLTLRRAASARALLLAATGATLIITVLLTGLAAYSRDTVAAGARSALSDAPAQERSVLLRGPVGTSRTYGERDAAVQAAMAAGFGGRAARVNATAAAAGLELSGDLPAGMSGGALASVVFLDGLPDRAELVSGAWPHATTGDGPAQAALVEPVATLLGVAVGDRVPITSRLSRRPADVVVSGIFRPRDPGDPYWLLAPGAQTGVAPQSSTYGPFVVAREDFLRAPHRERLGLLVDRAGAGRCQPGRAGVGRPGRHRGLRVAAEAGRPRQLRRGHHRPSRAH